MLVVLGRGCSTPTMLNRFPVTRPRAVIRRYSLMRGRSWAIATARDRISQRRVSSMG